jgi:hypothetical protein
MDVPPFLDRLVRELHPVFAEIMENVKILVTEKQRDYWMSTDWLLYKMCENLNLDWIKGEY